MENNIRGFIIQFEPRKGFESAVCVKCDRNIVYIMTHSVDPNPFRRSHCICLGYIRSKELCVYFSNVLVPDKLSENIIKSQYYYWIVFIWC